MLNTELPVSFFSSFFHKFNITISKIIIQVVHTHTDTRKNNLHLKNGQVKLLLPLQSHV